MEPTNKTQSLWERVKPIWHSGVSSEAIELICNELDFLKDRVEHLGQFTKPIRPQPATAEQLAEIKEALARECPTLRPVETEIRAYRAPVQPTLCPVCQGTMSVPAGFYRNTSTDASAPTHVPCRACVNGLVR